MIWKTPESTSIVLSEQFLRKKINRDQPKIDFFAILQIVISSSESCYEPEVVDVLTSAIYYNLSQPAPSTSY